MDEFDDLSDDFSTYNGDTEHDVWVDYTTHMYTGELDDIFGDIEED